MPVRRFVLLLSLAGAAACSSSTTEPNATLAISLTASSGTAAAGDTISLVATASGTNLIGLLMDYGDATSDAYSTHGANSARVTFRHAYLSRGTFTARVAVTDGAASQKEATVEIQVN